MKPYIFSVLPDYSSYHSEFVIWFHIFIDIGKAGFSNLSILYQLEIFLFNVEFYITRSFLSLMDYCNKLVLILITSKLSYLICIVLRSSVIVQLFITLTYPQFLEFLVSFIVWKYFWDKIPGYNCGPTLYMATIQ